MNNSENQPCCARWSTPLGIVGALLIMGILVGIMVHYTRPEDLNAKRAAERAKALAEINAQNAEALSTYGWADQAKGLVRLPIQQAMDLTINLWQNPAAARSNLMERVEKATKVAPPAPSPFE